MSDVRADYARYYAEKLWEMLPAVYRDEDGRASPAGQFRGLVEVVADRIADLRLDQDRLWDDQSIDLADDWVVPYIGELLATRLLSARNARGRRIDVAKTIYYRRRKGTPRVLEELISDIAGWDGKVVEEFRRLARVRHGLDPAPLPLTGRFTDTPPGGLADLRRLRASHLTGSAFDEFHYTPDTRRPLGRQGRYGISKVGLHLHRLMAIPVEGAQPMVWPSAPGAPRRASIDPSGRDIQIFMRRDRSDDWDNWESAPEWALPGPMSCRLLGHADYRLRDVEVALIRDTPLLAPAARAAAAADLAPWVGTLFRGEGELRRVLASFASAASLTSPPVFQALLESALVADCGKARLLPDGTDPGSIGVSISPGVPVARVATTSGELSAWTLALGGKALAIDPERGRLLLAPAAGSFDPRIDYAFGLASPIGATPIGRGPTLAPPSLPPVAPIIGGAMPAALAPAGVNIIDDSLTYGQPPNRNGVDGMAIQAADGQRPFIQLGGSWTLTAAAAVEATLTLNGLWLAGAGGGPIADLRLAGDYETVRLLNVTIDPGGVDALGQALRPVRLIVTGAIETLEIDNSILSGVFLQAGGSIENLVIRDSIVRGSDDAGSAAPLSLTGARLTLERSSVMWNRPNALTTLGVDVAWLYASEALITCLTDVTDLQSGCFRFSATAKGSRVPHPYESHDLTDLGALFVSWRFGDAGFGVLGEVAPPEVARGGLDKREMGAFAALNWPIRRDGLAAKIDEFMPFGLAPTFIDET